MECVVTLYKGTGEEKGADHAIVQGSSHILN